LYRILLLRENGLELLVAGERPPFTLPCVEIPRWERVAENMNAAVRKRLAISPVCLFTPDVSVATTDSEQPLYQVMETREAGVTAPDGTQWLPVGSFADQSFADAQDSRALTNTLRQIHEFENGEIIGPFGKPGWIEALSSWVQHEVDPYGLCLSGEFRQLNASPTFALLRFETNGSAVWFKAVGEPNLREFPISVTLSRLFPGVVPTVIANHPAWHGWLTTEFAGSTLLDEVPNACAWERAGQTLGELQIASVGMTDQLLDVGCRDLRVTSLLRSVDPFLEVMTQLMEQQRKTPPPALDRDELLTLGSQIKETLSELAELGIPNTLGHLDFNPGNILCSADQCVFLDWAEAYVGPPFLTFEYLRTHLTRTQREGVGLSADVVNAYKTQWHTVLSPEVVAVALNLAPVLAAFVYAAGTEGWRNPTLLREPRAAAYLRSLTRRMRVEMQRLQERRQFCCN
jgi:Ser/Thr protein kinase RdoA (MazF antagonist)